MTVKYCDHSHKEELYRRILFGVIALVVAVLLVIFLFWIITRPTKPTFVLQDVTLSAFNLSSPTTLTTNLQITISSRNPNQRIGVYYQRIDVYASYRNQQISLPTALPATYQGHKDINVWSPFLCGDAVPVSPYVADALCQDLNTGMVLVNIKVDGRVKWKVGTWMSGNYHLQANCPAYINLGERSKGIGFGGAVKYQFVQGCTVDV
ncbi:hypothetical protein Dsin_019663 [Dipteronia sinensis]|uniref:Late embryogenesis abundant protein LEA-2 subgroup domain-containing protein n=1 Tax=Dipteronia sinensis TaxID=43782 RepID=A0AAE0E2Q7_9ROSI|nr:hypothetical protein Dsin_019663 [Dipteronia sinensis]